MLYTSTISISCRRWLLGLVLLLLSAASAPAQVSGLKRIPGDYPTLAAAITQLNADGVGSAGVVLELERGYTEFATNLTLTASGTAAGPLVMRAAAGAGAAPRIGGSNGSGTTDAVLKLVGCDYVTIQGLEFTTLGATSSIGQAEWGVALLKNATVATAGPNGCQHVEISGCTFRLPLAADETAGVYIANHPATSTAAFTPTGAAGTHSFITLDNNQFMGGAKGILLVGYNAPAATPALLDAGNVISHNTISNFNQLATSLVSNQVEGVVCQYQANVTVTDNTLSSSVTGVEDVRGIWLGNLQGQRTTITRNRITLQSRGRNYSVAGIYCHSRARRTVLADNSCSLDAEMVYNGPQGLQYITPFEVLANRTDLLRNKVIDCVASGSGRRMHFMGFKADIGDSTLVAYNRVLHLTLPTAEQVQALYVRATGFTEPITIERNTVADISTAGYLIGIDQVSASQVTVARNKVGDLTSTFVPNTLPAVQGIQVSGNDNVDVHNNLIGNLLAPASTGLNGVVGLTVQAGFRRRIYYNTVHLQASSSAATFGSAALYTPGPGEVDIRNNILVNKSVPAGAGITAAWRNNLGNPNTTNVATDHNVFFAGTPGATRVLYADEARPADNRATLATLQTLWAPRNARSITEDTPLLGTAALEPTFLHLDATNFTRAESGGQVIASFVHDYDTLNTRLAYPLAGQLNGSGTAPDIGADEGDYRRGTPVAVPPAAPVVTGASRCGAGSVTLAATGAPVGGSYRWYSVATGGTPIAGATTSSYLTPSLTASQTYYVSAVSADGTEGPRTAVTATIQALPAASLTASAAGFCPGGSVTLMAGGGASGSQYQFLRNGQLLGSSVATPTLVTYLEGSYSVTITTPGAACAGTSAPVAVAAYAPAVAVAGAARSVCANESTQLGAPAVAGTTYAWSPATGLSSATAAQPTLTLPNATSSPLTATYTLTATTASGCTATSSVTVTVNPAPQAQAGADAAVCAGSSVRLGAAAVAGYTYQWSPGTNLSSATAANPTVTAGATAATLTYTLTVTGPGGCTSTDAVTVTVYARPATPVITQSGNLLTSSSPAGNQWYLNGVPIPGATAGSYQATSSGTYTVVVTGPGNCTATSAAVTLQVVTASASSSPATSLRIAPNPTLDGRVLVTLLGYRQPVALLLLDALGRPLDQAVLAAPNFQEATHWFDLSRVPAGVYVLRVQTAEQVTWHRIVRN